MNSYGILSILAGYLKQLHFFLSALVMEKSWNIHGKIFYQVCGNPESFVA